MKILVVGSGGREHAVIMKLKESKHNPEIFCAPGNGGISRFATCFDVKATDIDGMVKLAQELTPDFVVVTPDDPLALGMVDALEEIGIKAFGPNKAAAQIEASKVFSKGLMKKYNIPTAEYESFSDPTAAKDYIKSYPTVIKADGLAAGKGVIIAETEADAFLAIDEIFGGKFGDSGKNIVIEEFMTGPEISVLCFCDGETLRPMISSMDHKRIFDNDKGLNTGGMGTIAPNPVYTPEVEAECLEKIFIPTIKAMSSEGRPFKGCLYFGLMKTISGVKVIEFNCRFGDPETQVVLPMLEGDLVDLMLSTINGNLSEIPMSTKPGACACVIESSKGYPEKYETGFEITGLNKNGQSDLPDTLIFHAGTSLNYEGKFLTAGGRVLGITATGTDLKDALNKAYKAVETITFDGEHHRTDIGSK
ncbi:MAG: phosphoribosylamine--glycine ligase [Ruminococcus sp.]|jgi:phosphoribosylamine--glycine ligase|nr:phosphoribosylamine--glycine ligase [Ruminococcus sp.]